MEDQFSAGHLVVRWKGEEFDVTKFAETHPGGPDVLWLCKDAAIDQYLSGSKSLDGVRHCHSAAACALLNKMRKEVDDKQLLQDDPVDYSKPVMDQVGGLGELYWDWLHHPISHDIRIFQSDFVEFFSRTRWWLVPTVWLPIAFWIVSQSVFGSADRGDMGTLEVSTKFLFGLLLWTLMEYLLHRCIFHMKPPVDSPFWIRFHFLMHGLHHKTPFDKGRLVFPIVPAMLIFMVVCGLYSLLLSYPTSWIVAAGTLVGYVGYDVIHYYLHHGHPQKNSYWGRMKSYHYAHHFKDWNKGFGISSKLWDIPMGTLSRG